MMKDFPDCSLHPGLHACMVYWLYSLRVGIVYNNITCWHYIQPDSVKPNILCFDVGGIYFHLDHIIDHVHFMIVNNADACIYMGASDWCTHDSHN